MTESLNIREADIQKTILDWLAFQPGIKAFRTNNIGVPIPSKDGRARFRPSPVKGLADILVCWRGRFVAIEVKRPGKHPTDDQSTFLDDVIRTGGIGIVAHSLEDVQRMMKSLSFNNP